MYSNNPTNLRLDTLKSIRNLLRYYDLGYILNNLESLIVLPVPIKYAKQSKEDYEKNRNIYNQTYLAFKNASSDLENESTQRENIFEYLRTIKPDFCLKMSEKNPEEHKKYVKLITDFNKDIAKLSFSLKERDEKDYSELLLSKKDSSSKIIDSPYYAEMANIEDRFVYDELEKFNLEKITDQDMLENILRLKENLQQRISKHQSYDKLNHKGNKIVLRLGKYIPPSIEDER